LQQGIYDEFLEKLIKAYKQLRIGDPTEEHVLCGPLHTKAAVDLYRKGIDETIKQGGQILYGGKVLDLPGNFVEPAVTHVPPTASVLKNELFVPILHTVKFKTLEEAIEYNNNVNQGLSSSLFTRDVSNVFKWTG
jgi:aldehyde dehydrogenase family 7 protein A1